MNGKELEAIYIGDGVLVRPKRRDVSRDKDAHRNPIPLTEAQKEVLELVSEGTSNKRIAALRGTSERTVKTHVSTILIKLRANDRTHAVVIALRLGWIAI